MMTPTLAAIARQLGASPRWRPIDGFAWTTPDGFNVGRVDSNLPTIMQPPAAAIPDLSDPVTAAALLVLAREVSGDPHLRVWARRIGEDVWYVAAGIDGPGRLLYTHRSEVEALAAVILRGGG